MYTLDWLTGRLPGNHLKRSASLLPRMTCKSIHRHIVVLLTGQGPVMVAKSAVSHSYKVRRVATFCSLVAFLRFCCAFFSRTTDVSEDARISSRHIFNSVGTNSTYKCLNTRRPCLDLTSFGCFRSSVTLPGTFKGSPHCAKYCCVKSILSWRRALCHNAVLRVEHSILPCDGTMKICTGRPPPPPLRGTLEAPPSRGASRVTLQASLQGVLWV